MTKHEKRLERARNNPKDVSYEDFVSMLEKEGYTIKQGKGSHQRAYKQFGDENFKITFVRPHGNHKTMHKESVIDFLSQFDEMKALEEAEENE